VDMFSIAPSQRKRKKKNFEQKLDLWVEVWSVHIDKFFYCLPVIIYHTRDTKVHVAISKVKDLSSNEYGSWFGRKKDNLKKKRFIGLISETITEDSNV